MILAKKGLENLKITYRDDDTYLSKLTLCIDNLTERIKKNRESFEKK